MVGSAIVRALQEDGYTNLIERTRAELDLTDERAVAMFFAKEKPEYVFLAAAKVGGILANAEGNGTFFYDNTRIQLNVIHQCHVQGVKKLLFLGSSCIYPKLAEQPLVEDSLMTGHLEPTNFGYAMAKISGVKMCEAYHEQYGMKYVALMPCNLYGPNDNFDPVTSHVLPALLRKVIEAKERGDKEIVLWGTGKPYREFLFVDDLAKACVFMMNHPVDHGLYNVGAGKDIQLIDVLRLIFSVTGYEGEIIHDTSKPDGTPKKLMDSSKIQALGWKPEVGLEDGLARLLEWYQQNR